MNFLIFSVIFLIFWEFFENISEHFRGIIGANAENQKTFEKICFYGCNLTGNMV